MATERSDVHQELAGRINQEVGPYGSSSWKEVNGIRYNHMLGWLGNVPYDQGWQIPKETWSAYNHLEEVFASDKLPSSWVEVIKEAEQACREEGNDYPVDLFAGVYYTIRDNPRATELGITNFAQDASGNIDLAVITGEQVVERINAVIEDELLREQLIKVLSVAIPEGISSYIYEEELKTVVDRLSEWGIQSGKWLDLGSGVGSRTQGIQRLTPLKVIGLDRLYRGLPWFEAWHDPDLSFARADIRELPLADNSARVISMLCVAAHITKDALETSLDEASRVLEEKGVLIVGPQDYDSDRGDSFRYYVKMIAPGGVPILVGKDMEELKIHFGQYYYRKDKISGRVFGDSRFIGDDDLLGLSPEDQLVRLGWSHACTDPEGVVKEYGIEWAIKRYSQVNFWTGWIWQQAESINPTLAGRLKSGIERQPLDLGGKHNSESVPRSHLSKFSPMSTPWGYASARVLIEGFDRAEKASREIGFDSESERRDWLSREMISKLNLIDRSLARASTPAEFLAIVGNEVYKTGVEPGAILSHIFSTVLGEEACCSLLQVVAGQIKKKSPGLWRAYHQLGPTQKKELGIVGTLSPEALTQELGQIAENIFTGKRGILASFNWLKERPAEAQRRLAVFDKTIGVMNQLMGGSGRLTERNKALEDVRYRLWRKELPTIKEMSWKQLFDSELSAVLRTTLEKSGLDFSTWANAEFSRQATPFSGILVEGYALLLSELWFPDEDRVAKDKFRRDFVLAFESVLINRFRNSRLLSDVFVWMKEEKNDFPHEVVRLIDVFAEQDPGRN
jgi:ubiquinone/menaquinone biosynthesis C-methylase UbiE